MLALIAQQKVDGEERRPLGGQLPDEAEQRRVAFEQLVDLELLAEEAHVNAGGRILVERVAFGGVALFSKRGFAEATQVARVQLELDVKRALMTTLAK